MPPRRHALQRAIGRMTLGAVQSVERRRQLNEEMAYAEVQEQFQLAVSGSTSTSPIFATTAEILFDYAYFYAPGQRESDLLVPQFWFGSVIDEPVMLTASVVSWTADADNDATIGAVVRVGAVGADAGVDYAGWLHLTFQGYGALIEDESEDVE